MIFAERVVVPMRCKIEQQPTRAAVMGVAPCFGLNRSDPAFATETHADMAMQMFELGTPII